MLPSAKVVLQRPRAATLGSGEGGSGPPEGRGRACLGRACPTHRKDVEREIVVLNRSLAGRDVSDRPTRRPKWRRGWREQKDEPSDIPGAETDELEVLEKPIGLGENRCAVSSVMEL